ncbi:MAG: MotA/TolQ/ExbB proton channel family protein [Bacteroidetes bacterium]|jgi:biopolymer transport protein ExbB|nr:MotA/TolQ/ExbB proton channel family protein [Bacteroidota bacterium]
MILSIILQASGLADTPEMPSETANSLWQSIEKGGVIMIPIGILFITAIYIFIERYLTIRNSTRKEGNFLAQVKSLITDGKSDEAIELCRKTDSPLGRMVEKGINRIERPIKEIEESIEVEGKFEVYELEKGLPILSAIAGIAPMFGFLGTILGVIKIFSDISVTADVSIGTVSAGLYVKMISSAAGLLVGIVAYIFYNWLNLKISKIVNKMERNAIGFIDFLKDNRNDKPQAK